MAAAKNANPTPRNATSNMTASISGGMSALGRYNFYVGQNGLKYGTRICRPRRFGNTLRVRTDRPTLLHASGFLHTAHSIQGSNRHRLKLLGDGLKRIGRYPPTR